MRELRHEPYGNEDELQALLASHPHLLAGEQLNPEEPRRWLLVAREVGVTVVACDVSVMPGEIQPGLSPAVEQAVISAATLIAGRYFPDQ